MTLGRGSRIPWIVLGILAASSLVLPGTSGWALGPTAPPSIVSAAVWVDASAQDFNGNPQLFASLEVEIPGGNVPINVENVAVVVPGRGAYFLPLDRSDLSPERSYLLNLTQAGVSGFPTGIYTFTATDTSGGFSTTTDSFVVSSFGTPGIPPPASISVTGLVHAPAANGVVNLLDVTATPTPTVSWTSVDGAAGYRLQIRGSFGDQDLFSRATSGTSMKLPSGVMVPGRRYRVRLDAFDSSSGLPNANARSRNQIEVVTQGPEIFLTFGQGPYTAGQTLNVTARIYNTGPAVTVNAEAWIGTPTSGVIPILNMPGLTVSNSTANPTGPNNLYSGPIGFSYLLTGSEASGTYVVGLRLTDPATGETVALTTRTFVK